VPRLISLSNGSRVSREIKRSPCWRLLKRVSPLPEPVRILFDQGTPAPLRKYLANHEVKTAVEMGWSRLTNGQLLDAAEETFDLLITADQQLRQQQNLADRKLAILVLPTTS
jgi:hypothetical protein